MGVIAHSYPRHLHTKDSMSQLQSIDPVNTFSSLQLDKNVLLIDLELHFLIVTEAMCLARYSLDLFLAYFVYLVEKTSPTVASPASKNIYIDFVNNRLYFMCCLPIRKMILVHYFIYKAYHLR